ncbi:MAG TPA: glycoside hydrolase family 16 protein [Blastocatellia bacterium]|nr:glycoside hydrolase family 16 protein [Blastocatellia bacterium]
MSQTSLTFQADESGDRRTAPRGRLPQPKSERPSATPEPSRATSSNSLTWAGFLLMALCILLSGCRLQTARVGPSIEFSKVPQAGEGGPDKLDTIEGRVTGARPGQQVVLFARSGVWWVQPVANEPFTIIQPDSTWKNSTHLGTEYAALLVEPGYRPPPTMEALPKEGGGVIAVATVEGEKQERAGQKTLHFSGYEWEVRQLASDRAGTRNAFDPANAWTDERGFLHLRIARKSGEWTCAEVKLTRSLGYGSYLFVVRETSHLEPAAVLSMFTREDSGPDPNSREMNIEISRWGDPASKGGQYVIQPYYVPANAARFAPPPGVLTHSFRWEPGRVLFKTTRGAAAGEGSRAVAEHVFTSGVPSPGGESIRINLYVFGNERNPLRNETEVVIEKFEYLP